MARSSSSTAAEVMEETLNAKSLAEMRVAQHVRQLSALVKALAVQHYDDFENKEDAAGALITHCLLISNTEASRNLAIELFEAHPRLLLRVHSHADYEEHRTRDPAAVPLFLRKLRSLGKMFGARMPYTGEGPLHIAAVMEQEDLFLKIMHIAFRKLDRYNSQGRWELKELFSQCAIGSFFDDEPICFFGGRVACFAAACGMRRALSTMHLMQDVIGFDPVNECPAVWSNYLPVHAAAANGHTSMIEYLVAHCGASLDAECRDSFSTVKPM
eukprot:6270927-Prymnesium_polylepis.1